MAPTTVLITGANRGLGEGLVSRYLAKPDHIVIAACRNPDHPTSQALSKLPKAEGTTLAVVKWDASVDGDAFAAVEKLQTEHGLQYLDIVIANAGVCDGSPTVAGLNLGALRTHMAPNVFGFLTTYQATRPLLQKSSKEPVFAPMGSTAGCVENQPPIPNAAYGPTKAMVNWYTVRINAEDDWLNAFVLSPGWVQTDLGDRGARGLGMEKAFLTVEESCDGMMDLLAGVSKEKHGGKMINYDGVSDPLDAFAYYRRGKGLCANTVDLGVIKDVGYMADVGGSALEGRFDKREWTSIDEASEAQIITGISYSLSAKVSGLAEDRRFGYLFSSGAKGSGKDSVVDQDLRSFRVMHASGTIEASAMVKAAVGILL